MSPEEAQLLAERMGWDLTTQKNAGRAYYTWSLGAANIPQIAAYRLEDDKWHLTDAGAFRCLVEFRGDLQWCGVMGMAGKATYEAWSVVIYGPLGDQTFAGESDQSPHTAIAQAALAAIRGEG